jgi:hypothetical protein
MSVAAICHAPNTSAALIGMTMERASAARVIDQRIAVDNANAWLYWWLIDANNPDETFWRIGLAPKRVRQLIWYEWPRLRVMSSWFLSSKETTNFTYDITDRNLSDLADFLAALIGFPRSDVVRFLEEPLADAALRSHIQDATSRSQLRSRSDRVPRYGRRLGWYALVRLLKPKVVVETGVDKGLGSHL